MRDAFNELTVADVMREHDVTIPETMSLPHAAQVLAEAGASAAPVVDTRGRCVGLLRASDLLHCAADEPGSEPVPAGFWSEWQLVPSDEPEVWRRMTPAPVVPPDAPIREVARELLAVRITAVVVDGRHRPLGILFPADILAAVSTDRRPQASGRPRPAGLPRGAALKA